jgi:hypothetical protein
MSPRPPSVSLAVSLFAGQRTSTGLMPERRRRPVVPGGLILRNRCPSGTVVAGCVPVAIDVEALLRRVVADVFDANVDVPTRQTREPRTSIGSGSPTRVARATRDSGLHTSGSTPPSSTSVYRQRCTTTTTRRRTRRPYCARWRWSSVPISAARGASSTGAVSSGRAWCRGSWSTTGSGSWDADRVGPTTPTRARAALSGTVGQPRSDRVLESLW